MTANDETSGAVDRFDCVVGGKGAFASETREAIREIPMRIVVNGSPVATLMQTPGNEVELALGFLLTEGYARTMGDVGAVSFCREGTIGEAGEVRVQLAGDAPGAARRGYRDVLSSCGLCGEELIEAFAEALPAFSRSAGRLSEADIRALREAMNASQPLFRKTGGAHAAAIAPLPFEEHAREIVVREDIGRHNALDKTVGAACGAGLPLDRCLLFLSSRLSVEMVAKAARVGIGDVAGIGAASATAVLLARKLGMFLAGFARGETMTIYSDAGAVASSGEGET